ncbi:MAG TPA: ferredoxin [Blattabacteriaceae bacterium]
MYIITLQRNKCIGCNYCSELAPEYFRISKKDGKSVLLHSIDKNGFFVLKKSCYFSFESYKKASRVCPVGIITIKKF